MQLVAIILTRNEAHNVGPCIESLSWCDQVVVFDAYSLDDTTALARDAGAVVIQHPFQNFSQQRNAALAAVEGEWILFVDADERGTPALGQEVRRVIQEGVADGWWVPRDNYIFGHLTRGGGYYPDYQMRLLRAGRARYERPASEIVVLDGVEGYLENPLIHYNYRSVAEFHAKQRAREPFEATTLHRQGVRLRPRTFFLQPLREFRRRFVTLKGYQDGWHGLRLSLLLAYYFGWRNYRRLWQMRRAGAFEEGDGQQQ